MSFSVALLRTELPILIDTLLRKEYNPIESALPEIQMIDLQCQDFERLRFNDQTPVRNIRMIGCWQENVWSKQDKTWSMAVLGIDKSGNALFIFTESHYSGYDFVNIL